MVAFTTAVQLDHLLQVAGERGPELLRVLNESCVVASIGPTATEALREQGVSPDIEPEHPKLGYLAAAIAEAARSRLTQKRGSEGVEAGSGKSRLSK